MSSDTACPSSDSWQGLINGSLPGHVTLRLAQHLEACGRCQARVERLLKGSKTWVDVAKNWRSGLPALSPACHQGMDQAKSLAPPLSAPGNVPAPPAPPPQMKPAGTNTQIPAHPASPAPQPQPRGARRFGWKTVLLLGVALGAVVGLIVSIAFMSWQPHQAERVTADFKQFATDTEAAIRDDLLDGPGMLKVTYDVNQSTSTIKPFSAVLTISYAYEGRSASAAAKYSYSNEKWQTEEIGDFGAVADLREERRRGLLTDFGIPKEAVEKAGVMQKSPEELQEARSCEKFLLEAALEYRTKQVPDVKKKLLRLYALDQQITGNLQNAVDALKGNKPLSTLKPDELEHLQAEQEEIKRYLGWN